MVHAAQQNQNNQICSNDPRYQYLWANSHKHNPNPQQYATTLLTGIDLVGKRQENFKLSLDGFTKDVSNTKTELEKNSNKLSINTTSKAAILKEKNQRILEKILKLESLTESIYLAKNQCDRKNNQEMYLVKLIENSSDQLLGLENKISDMKYFLETKRNVEYEDPALMKDAFERSYSTTDAMKTQNKKADLFETLKSMQGAISTLKAQTEGNHAEIQEIRSRVK